MEVKAKRGLKSQNAHTLKTWVSVCIWHSPSCHSTGLTVGPTLYQHPHLCFLFALEDDPRRPHQEKRTPCKKLITLNQLPPILLPKNAHLPSLPPSFWSSELTFASHNKLQLQSHRVTLTESRETPECPWDSAAVTLTEKERLRRSNSSADLHDVQSLQACSALLDRSRIQAPLPEEGMSRHSWCGQSRAGAECGREADEGR